MPPFIWPAWRVCAAGGDLALTRVCRSKSNSKSLGKTFREFSFSVFLEKIGSNSLGKHDRQKAEYAIPSLSLGRFGYQGSLVICIFLMFDRPPEACGPIIFSYRTLVSHKYCLKSKIESLI